MAIKQRMAALHMLISANLKDDERSRCRVH